MFEDTFWKSGAGWIACAITVGLFVLKAWMDRKRPQKVVCRQYRTTSLVSVQKSVGQRIKVSLDDKVVRNLSLIEFTMFNSGDSIIKDINVKFKFHAKTQVLDLLARESRKMTDGFLVTHAIIEPNVVEVIVPYLNSFSEHRHKIALAILCDGNVEGVETIGGGVGWSTEYEEDFTSTNKAKKVSLRWLMLAGFISLTALTGTGVFEAYINRQPIIKSTAFAVFQAVCIVGVLLCFVRIHFISKRIKEMERGEFSFHEEITQSPTIKRKKRQRKELQSLPSPSPPSQLSPQTEPKCPEERLKDSPV